MTLTVVVVTGRAAGVSGSSATGRSTGRSAAGGRQPGFALDAGGRVDVEPIGGRGAGRRDLGRRGGLHHRGLAGTLVLVAVRQAQLLALADRRAGAQVVFLGQGGGRDREALGDGEHRVAALDDIGLGVLDVEPLQHLARMDPVRGLQVVILDELGAGGAQAAGDGVDVVAGLDLVGLRRAGDRDHRAAGGGDHHGARGGRGTIFSGRGGGGGAAAARAGRRPGPATGWRPRHCPPGPRSWARARRAA